MTQKFPRWLWMLTLLIAAIFALDITPWVRGGYGWRWEYVPVMFERNLPMILAISVYIGGAYLLITRNTRVRWVLIWALMGTVILSLAVAYAREGDALYMLFTRTASIASSAEWWGGATIDWQNGAWRDWVGVMAALGQHTSNIGTAPPGVFMLYAGLTDLLDKSPALTNGLYRMLLPYQCHNYEFLTFTPAEWASAWLGMLTPLWAGLAVFPIYGITRKIAPEADARFPVIWWALVPGILGFVTSSSTFYPVITLIIFWLMMQGRGYIFAAGMVYGVGMFLNFIFLPLAALYGFYTLLYNGKHWTRSLMVGFWFGIGALIPWVIFYLLTRQTFLDMLAQSLNTHFDLDRPYWYWVWMHLWDWAIWSGLTLSLVWLWGLWRGWRAQERVPTLALALLLTVLAFTLSGTTRGESGRIWLALAPFLLIAAVEVQRISTRNLMGLTVLHGVMALVLCGVLAVYNAPELTRPPEPPVVNITQPIDAVFADGDDALYRLTGWGAESDGTSITLRLQWEGIQRPLSYQWFGAVLVDPNGATYPIDAWQPGGETDFPTTCWDTGMIIGDTISLPLPDTPIPGDWYISLAAYSQDGQLTVSSKDTQVGLGPVPVG